MHEVTFKFTVKSSDNDQEAVDMATDYFCGGDYAGLVTEHEVRVKELHGVQDESEATEAR